MVKTQVLLIHGGNTFKTRGEYLNYLKKRDVSLNDVKSWSREYLKNSLGKNFQFIRPPMPLKENARYQDWALTFEKYFPYLKDNIILIGNSLGGIFLAKYLSENKFPKKILSTYLVAPPYSDIQSKKLAGGFNLKTDLSLLEENTKNLYLFFSEDDPIIPPSHRQKYQKKLKKAKIFIFKNKNGHFRTRTFPELIKMIKSDVKNARS